MKSTCDVEGTTRSVVDAGSSVSISLCQGLLRIRVCDEVTRDGG
jgi:hypothetical protein